MGTRVATIGVTRHGLAIYVSFQPHEMNHPPTLCPRWCSSIGRSNRRNRATPRNPFVAFLGAREGGALRALSRRRSLAGSVPFRPQLRPPIRSFGGAMPRVALPAMRQCTRRLYLCDSCVRCYFRELSASGVAIKYSLGPCSLVSVHERAIFATSGSMAFRSCYNLFGSCHGRWNNFARASSHAPPHLHALSFRPYACPSHKGLDHTTQRDEK